jgi:predicted phosphohydrolase
MIIQYASDLHLEFPENKVFVKATPLQAVGDVLLLAGDIVPFALLDQHKDFFTFLSDNFAKTYWIPGNHEYYHFDAATKHGMLNEKIRNNVFLLNNTSLILDGVKFIFSTLWSKINPANEWQIERSVNDFHVIKYGGARFSAQRFNELHADCMSFLNQELATVATTRNVVVTHHVPTFMNYPKKHKGDILNEAFAVELFDLIEATSPNYWIYGHTHCNTPDFKIGKTKLLTNQLGYVKYDEHKLFSVDKHIKI